MKLFTKIVPVLSFLVLFVPLIIQAASGGYGLDQVPSELPRDDIAVIIVRVISYITGAVGIILLVMLIYGGVLYMTSAGSEDQAKKAKSVLTYAIIGIVIVALSFAITQFIVGALTGGSGTNP
jgi:hypothetical protein